MQRRPLANDFAVGAGVFNFIGGDAGEMVGRGVANTVAAGLDRVHLDAGEFFQNLRNIFELGPIELQVLARAEMAETLVEASANVGEFAQLFGVHRAVGDGDAQHIRQTLVVQTILQTQRQELLRR